MEYLDFQRTNQLFGQNTHHLLEQLRKELPPVFTRKVAERAVGGFVSVNGPMSDGQL